MRLFLSLILLSLIISSCSKSQSHKINYTDIDQPDSLTIDDISADTTKILIAALPVYFDSTNILIHPIGLINIEDIRKGTEISEHLSSYSKTEKYKELYFYMNDENLSGKITNLYFDDFESGNHRLLTNKIINISNVRYLRPIAKKTNRHYLIYSVYDKDTNRDKELNSDDICSLYISNLDGTEFRKITQENHEYLEGKMIVPATRYYFTSIEDINKDGKFGKDDKYHYSYIDFSTDPYQIKKFDPLKN